MIKTVAVFCGSQLPKDPCHATSATLLGHKLAYTGRTLVYGGSNLGLMGLVSSAAMERGGEVVAVIPSHFSEAVINSQKVTRLERVASMAERKRRIMQQSDAFVALAGGIGTIDEVSEVMVANQLGLMDKPLIILNEHGYYDHWLQWLDMAKAEGMMRGDCGLAVADSVTHVMMLLAMQ
ncbi:MAG: TIGR00730 family Rossman fold protein [Bacteroidales bacterium]|nr:TIGR00730 family Rossman fold protein [Bacteroidales bacterium]